MARQVPSASNRPPPRVNRLLAALPSADYQRLSSTLQITPLKLKEILQKPGEPVEHVYFPGGGFCSIVTVLENGSMVEVATVGREGMVGLGAMVSADLSASLTMVQGESDTCYTMTASAFRDEMDRRGALYKLATRFGQALTGFIMQSTACNAAHSIEQRFGRWLLHAHDRMENDEFPLTQEFAAMMLGASRPMVTIAAGTLQRAGLITYHRGHVTIVDRERLESASCECYRAATTLLANVTPTSSFDAISKGSSAPFRTTCVSDAPPTSLRRSR
jgi:CRP-like cAMP-binding protein